MDNNHVYSLEKQKVKWYIYLTLGIFEHINLICRLKKMYILPYIQLLWSKAVRLVITLDSQWSKTEVDDCYILIFNGCGIWPVEWHKTVKWMTSSSPWWRHQFEKFSALLALCAVNSLVTGEFPAQRPVTRSFDAFFISAWINAWANNREAGDLGRHLAHYDVIVMEKNVYRCL